MICAEEKKICSAGYIRVSQERTARNGYGLGVQENDIRKYAAYKEIDLTKIYREEGQSGYKRERPALDLMLADAREGKFNHVIFPSIDRAGRSVKDIIDIESILREQGIGIIFLREGIDTSTPVGVLFRNVMASIAQFEGQLMYERMSKGKQRKASQGGYIGGWLPYGYEKGETGIIIVPGEAKIVKQIFQWRVEGLSLRQICDKLNDREVKTKRGCHWCVSTVRGMLMNRFYTGMVAFEHDYIDGQHQAIISEALFRSCQKGIEMKQDQ